MTTRLPSEKNVARQRNRVASVADRLTDDLLADLRRRAGEPVRRGTEGVWGPAPNEDGAGLGHHDGYPPGGDHAGGGKGQHSDPSWSRVEADYRVDPNTKTGAWVVTPDPVGDAIRDLFDKLTAMADLAVSIDKLADYVFNAERKARGRQATIDGVCLVCDATVSGVGNDRLRAGYCFADYQAWRRSEHYDRGDHLRFRRERRRQLRDQREGAA